MDAKSSSRRARASVQYELPLMPVPATAAGDGDIPVAIVRSPRRRTLAIHVDARGVVEVRAPMRSAREVILGFVARHEAWIRRKVDEARAEPGWTPEWRPGGTWFWQGQAVRFAAGGRGPAVLQAGELRLPLTAGAAPERWRRAAFTWHRRAAEQQLVARLTQLFALHGGTHRLRSIEFRWMRATWGTCGGRRAVDGRRDVVIRLNPWLAALPPALCDSVLLHELAHIEHMHHGAAFYRRLERLDPQWREHDRELKRWARLLFPVAMR